MRLLSESEPLTVEVEQSIAEAIQLGKDEDGKLRTILWKSGLKYCFVIAKGVHGVTANSSANVADIFSAGAEELWEQTLNFKPFGPARFTTFSRRPVKTACIESIYTNWSGMRALRRVPVPLVEVVEQKHFGKHDGYAVIERESQKQALLEELNRLPEGVQRVFKLYYGFDGNPLDTTQIGQKTGKTRQAVHAALKRGWVALKARSRLLT